MKKSKSKSKGILNDPIIQESGYTTNFGGRLKFALVYPNSYRIGMSNLGIHIIYQLLNSRADISCERFFLSATDISPVSIETKTPLNKFQVIGFAISFETDYFNVVKILKLAKIPVKANERTDFDPMIIAGGPCATFNPEPLSSIFDAFVIGEGEVVLPPLMDAISTTKLSRMDTLENISSIAGVYVPSLFEHVYNSDGTIKKIAADKKVSRQWLKNIDDFPAHSIILTDNAELNMYLIETARGCGRHCRFCMAGYCFRRPRNHSLEILKNEVDNAVKFGKKIGLMGAAISDYPQINELCNYILQKGLSMSVASFRADSVTEELVKALATSGLKTLTIAPEVGSEKMSKVVNKGINETHVFRAMELGIAAGIKNFKLYFMIGLPFEDISDVEAIVELAVRLRKFMNSKGGLGELTLSVNPFVPKPFTPFQWAEFADRKYLNAAIKILRDGLKNVRGVELIAESLKSAELQAILSRGDRKIAELVAQSDSIQKFRELLKTSDIDEDFYLRRERKFEEIFAWDALNQGFSKNYLYSEFKRAEELKSTPKCFDGCKRCGVCT